MKSMLLRKISSLGPFLGLCICLPFLASFCHRQTNGFTLFRIGSSLAPNPKWDVEGQPTDPLLSICNQRFTYIDKGGHCFVFVSEDGKHVLKFFRYRLIRTLPYLEKVRHFLPNRILQKMERRQAAMYRGLESLLLARKELAEETGLEFIQINPHRCPSSTIYLIDCLGIAHQLDLACVPFILQKKAVVNKDYLTHLIQTQDYEKMIDAFLSIQQLCQKRACLKIDDGDLKILKNLGFVDGRAVSIDTSDFSLASSKTGEEETDFPIMLERLKRFITEKDPLFADHFLTKWESVMAHSKSP